MATLVDSYALWKAAQAFERTLKGISQEAGHNTNPKVSIGAKQVMEVADGELPYLAIEFGDMALADEKLGGAEQGILRYGWETYVWGYVGSSGHRRELYRAGLALMVDVQSAIYNAETMPDGNGVGTVLMVNPGEVVFDMLSYADENRGFFRMEFELVVDLIRGGSP